MRFVYQVYNEGIFSSSFSNRFYKVDLMPAHSLFYINLQVLLYPCACIILI